MEHNALHLDECVSLGDGLPPGDSDSVLLGRFRAGDERAATELYRRYVGRLRAVAATQCGPDLLSRLDADDIVQSVFLSFFRRAAQGQYHVPEGEELWQLLVIITLNKVRSQGEFHRAAKRDVRLTSSGAEALTRLTEGRAGGQELTELRLLVGEVLEGLPPPQQRMVQLRLEGYEFSEIAQKTGRSRRTVERVLQDFRRALQGKLGEGNSDECGGRVAGVGADQPRGRGL